MSSGLHEHFDPADPGPLDTQDVREIREAQARFLAQARGLGNTAQLDAMRRKRVEYDPRISLNTIVAVLGAVAAAFAILGPALSSIVEVKSIVAVHTVQINALQDQRAADRAELRAAIERVESKLDSVAARLGNNNRGQ